MPTEINFENDMKRHSIFILLALCLLLDSCGSNVEKGRAAFDKGVNLMYNTTQFAEAEEQFTLAVKYDPNNYEAYYYRGCAKFNQKQYSEAIVDYEKALELKSDYADAEFSLGQVYFILNDHDMSCYYYKAAHRDGRPNMDDFLKACPD